jgi:hypothetical protein
MIARCSALSIATTPEPVASNDCHCHYSNRANFYRQQNQGFDAGHVKTTHLCV